MRIPSTWIVALSWLTACQSSSDVAEHRFVDLVSETVLVEDNLYVDGSLVFTGADPDATADPGANTMYGANVAKAWALIRTDGNGSAYIEGGFNAARASVSRTSIRLHFARAFANARYVVLATAGSLDSKFAVVSGAPTTAFVDIGVRDARDPTSLVSPADDDILMHVVVFGNQ